MLGESSEQRYEIRILIGPCYEDEAEKAMAKAHDAVDGLGLGAVASLVRWKDDERERAAGA